MTTTTLAQTTAFRDALAVSESTLQNDIGVAKATLTGTTLQTALDGAYRGHHGRALAAATSNGMGVPAHREGLIALNRKLPKESFSRSDTTAFTLVGGRYAVAVVGTFGVAGLVTLVNAGSEVFASFTDNGTTVLDLKYGVYNWTVADTTGLTALIQNGSYSA
jgi:hypothetical protein